MQIYICRHGIAEDGKPGGKDEDRALTTEGKKKLREVLRVAKAARVQPELILTSPYKRALESAEIVADVLGYKEELEKTKALIPGSTATTVWEEIRAHKFAESIVLVGHEPLLGQTIGFLLGAHSLSVDVKKGSITRVDVEQFGAQPRGTLRWMLTSRLATPA